MRAYLRGAPVHCTWQLSPRCESFCHLCEHRAFAAGDELDTAGCARVSDALAAEGSLLVSFTGSEPFLREDLPQVVAAVARRHFPLLVTNGWLVSPARAREVWQAGLEVASVSLEHADPARHDGVTGLPGSHGRAVAGLAALSGERTRRSQRVNVRTRLREAAADGLEALLALASGHGATVSLEAAYPLPRLDGEAAALVSQLRALKRSHPNLRTSSALLERTGEALCGGVGGCLAGRAFFNVDHRGQVSRCLEFRAPEDRVGCLVDSSLAEIRPALQRAAAANDCRACFYASRAEVETLFSLRGFVSGLRTLVAG
ncbi:MAG TPA: radical SAM protein [Vicinamibacteria bacterium]|nr:radical SAM protein [Vicinamibacteria bacterium]